MHFLGDWVEPGKLGDMWSSYKAERREIMDFIQTVPGLMGKIVMLNGDAHMIAMDNGRANTYATNGEKGFPIVVAAAMASGPQPKGMIPYSEGRRCTEYTHPPRITNYTTCDSDALIYSGMYPGKDQFAMFMIQDDGTKVEWGIVGKDHKGNEIVSMFSPGYVKNPGADTSTSGGGSSLSASAIVAISVLNLVILVLAVLCVVFIVLYCLKSSGNSSPAHTEMVN
jgi:hypothetical protein